MVTLETSGTQTATVGTEHVLYNPTTNKLFFAYVDTTNMASGDITELRIYVLIKTAGSYIQYSYDQLFNVQTNPLWYAIPLPSDLGWKLTLKQTAGTGRNYDYRVYSP